MPLGAPEDTEAHDFFSDYLSHALLSGYSDVRFIKLTVFNHIFSISTHCSFHLEIQDEKMSLVTDIRLHKCSTGYPN